MSTQPNQPIYLDYAATTPIDPVVAQAMADCLTQTGTFANPASLHRYGWEAQQKVETARAQVAALLGATPREIVWTSGATEAINLALKGYMHANQHRGIHLITCQTEHKSVLDTAAQLEAEGFDVTYLKPDAAGRYCVEQFAEAITPDASLLSVMWVNNETGVVQDIPAIAELAAQTGVRLHVDAVQAIGKLPLDVSAHKIDLLSMSAHKLYGPKGIGALYVRRGKPAVRLHALLHGGGHERGLRSGTLPTHQIVGMGLAYALAQQRLADDAQHMAGLKAQLWSGISTLPAVVCNGDLHAAAPHILNVQFHGVDGEALLMALQDLALSAGSACTAATIEPSHVLSAMGLSDTAAHQSLRFSLGRMTTVAEIEQALELITLHVTRLRTLSAGLEVKS